MKFIGIKKNCFNAIIKPDLYIANRNYKKYGIMSSNTLLDFDVDLDLYTKGKITFNYNKYGNDEYGNKVKNEYYKYIKEGNTLLWNYVAWFIITGVNENANKETKNVTCYTCEDIFSSKLVENVGNYNDIMNEDVSEQDVNLYSLYDPSDKNKSCLDIALAKLPEWRVDYVDENINGVYNKHTFSIDCTDAYSFLTQDVAESWDCIIMFDPLNKTIGAYRYDNPLIGKPTPVYLSLLNMVKNFDLETKSKQVTKYLVKGGNDGYLGQNNVLITDVNMGSNYLSDYTYVIDEFSDDLRTNYMAFQDAYNTNSEIYSNKVTELTDLYVEYYNLINKTTVEGSTVWSDYGLNALETEKDKRDVVISAYLSSHSQTAYELKEIAVAEKNGIEDELLVRNNQIDAKLDEIETLVNYMKTLIVNMNDYLSEDNLIELSNFDVEVEYTNDKFCTYATMSGEEDLSVKKDLKQNGLDKLQRDAQPQYELNIELSNLFNMEEFNDYSDEIELGSIIRINYDIHLKDSDAILDGRITHISFSFDNLDKINVTLTNKNLQDSWCLEEIRRKAETSTRYVASNNTSIKNATSKTKRNDDFVQNNFNAMYNQMSTNKDNEVIITEAGIDIKKKLVNGLYDKKQLRIYNGGIGITTTGWQGEGGGLDVAIGDIELDDGTMTYGINARCLMAELIISHQMRIINEALSLRIDEDGFNLTNSVNTIYMNPNDQECFQILKNGTKVMYLDVNGNLNLTGTIRGSSIIGGDANFGNGTTIISSDGKITTNNIEATDGKFMGEIVAKSGQIAGFTIDEYELEAGEGDKYIRISPTRVGTGSGEWDYNYAGISLGHTPDGLNSKIFLRSDGYARFGLEVYGGSIKFNYDGYSFYTKNFKIMQDTGDLFLGGSVTSNSYLSFMTGSGGIEFQSGMNGNKYILFYGSSMKFNDNPIATQSYVDSAIESAISTLEAYIDSHSTD